MTPSDILDTPYDILEITDQRSILNQTTYLVSQWQPEILTQNQIDMHLQEGFHPEYTFPITDSTFEVHWKPAWQTYQTIMDSPFGPHALDTYRRQRQSSNKKPRTAPPQPSATKGGWHPLHTTFSTQPINPNLDSTPTPTTTLRTHPSDDTQVLIHKPNGKILGTIDKLRLTKLYQLCQLQPHTTFESELAALICRSNTHGHKKKILREL